MWVFLKSFYLPLAIIACTAAGSIFAELNNFILFESKYNFSVATVEWFNFAVNASVLFGIVPSLLYSKYGVKKTIFIGGLLLTAAHVLASMLLLADKGSSTTTPLLFLVGVVGGQGSCIIFISALSTMLRYHSIVCTALLNGVLFSYYLGSDTFHLALKYGLFSEMSLAHYLLMLAGSGMLVYLICAIVFTKKHKDAKQETKLSRGVLLKREVQMYALVLAAYLGLVFMLLISFQSNTYWGSKVLIAVMAINLLIPVVVISFLNNGQKHKHISNPSETDRFLSTKGGNVTVKEAKKKREFWLALLSFGIIIGISRMIDDNSTLIALRNQNTYQSNQRSYQMFEVFGAFFTGIFLSIFRLYISPYAVLTFYSFLLVASQVLMFFISVSSLALYLAVIIVGFISGGTFTLMGIIAHEDYGPKYIAKILGLFMTAAAIGILIFDELVFDLMYTAFANEKDYNNQKSYGKWNKYIFIVSLLASSMALIMSFGAYLKTRKHDGNKDKAKDFINF